MEERVERSGGYYERVDKNTKSASLCSALIDQLEAKLADLEDRNRRSNLRMVGLEKNSECSDAAAFLMKSLPRWFPFLADKEIEVMHDHRIYNSVLKTLIFNLLQYSDSQSILQAARKNPLTLSGKEIKLFPDYSNYTAQCRKGFSQLIGWARPQGLQTFPKNICLKLQQTLRSSWIFWGLLVWAQCPSSSLKGWNMMEEDLSPGTSDWSSS
ncbi:UNVERIFIED_CONTAM: hypothetical protein FKN15_065759 [Acipenser sinensis]